MALELPRRLWLRTDPIAPGQGPGQRLWQADAPAVLAHYRALSPADRRTRFGRFMTDEGLQRWVASIDWGGHLLWGVSATEGLLAVLHLAPIGETGGWDAALSVAEGHRRQGWGRRLLALSQALAQQHTPDGHLSLQALPGSLSAQWLAADGTVTVEDDTVLARWPFPQPAKVSVPTSN
jgi:GNAT superfamily N-acetyltransferase